MDRIELRGLRALGTHGVLPEERQRPQPFEVDIDVDADLRAAGQSDALNDTVDYGSIAEIVEREIHGRHADLLEHLADRIATKILAAGAPRVVSVTVAIRKLRPPLAIHLDSIGVRIHRP